MSELFSFCLFCWFPERTFGGKIFILSTSSDCFFRWWWYFTLPWHLHVPLADMWSHHIRLPGQNQLYSCPTEVKEKLRLPFFFFSLFFFCPQECHYKQNNMQKKPKKSSPVPLCLHTMTIQMFSSVQLSCSIPWGKPYCPFKSILLPLIFTGRNTIHNACI